MNDVGKSISEGLIAYWDKKGRKKEEVPAKKPVSKILVSTPAQSMQAIRDKYGEDAPEALGIYHSYTANSMQIKSLVAQSKALKGKKNKEAKAKIKAQLAELRAKQKEIRAEAKRVKTLMLAKKKLVRQEKAFAKNKALMEKSAKRIQDLKKRLASGKGNTEKIRELLKKAEERELNQHGRNDALVEDMSESKNVISNKGIVADKPSLGKFGLSDRCVPIQLAEGEFKNLTADESMTNWKKLNDSYDSIEAELEAELENIMLADSTRISNTVEKGVSAGDIAVIMALAFLFFGKFTSATKSAFLSAYTAGVASAVGEVNKSGVISGQMPIPDTIQRNITQDINSKAQLLANTANDNLSNEIKAFVQTAFFVGVSASAISAGVREIIANQSKVYSRNVAGMVGDYVNKGRMTVYEKPELKIQIVGWVRSEVLDGRTCKVCQAMHRQVVKAGDPFAKLGQIHNSCRGLWLAIYDESRLENAGVPKYLASRFDMVGGYPITNSFKQFKKKDKVK